MTAVDPVPFLEAMNAAKDQMIVRLEALVKGLRDGNNLLLATNVRLKQELEAATRRPGDMI